MAITIYNGPSGSPQPSYTLSTFIAQTPVVVVNGVAAGGAAVPTTGQIWPRGSKA